MAFNSNPGNTTPSTGGSVDVSTTNFGRFPVLKYKDFGDAQPFQYMQSNCYEGFLGNNDSVLLPISNATDIEYRNNVGVTQWTVALTDINAACDDWCGFTFFDDLIYGVAVDEGTTPNTYYTFSIPVGGTVTNIGNDQPSSDFPTTSGSWFHSTSAAASGASFVQPDNTVTPTELWVIQRDSTGLIKGRIDFSNGQFLATPSLVPFSPTSLGIIIQDKIAVAYDTTQQFFMSDLTLDGQGLSTLDSSITQSIGLFMDNGRFFTFWKDTYYNTDSNNDNKALPFRFFADRKVFEDFIFDYYEAMTGRRVV